MTMSTTNTQNPGDESANPPNDDKLMGSDHGPYFYFLFLVPNRRSED